jgi:hypothetical protein
LTKSKSTTTTTRDELAAQSRAALASAQATEQQWREAVDAADLAAVEFEGRLTSGDESVSATDLLHAQAEQQRATLLLSAASKAVARAEKDLINTDERLGQAFAPIFAAAAGVEVTVDTMAPPKRSEREAPSLYLVQSNPAKPNKNGTLSGTLAVSYVRPQLFRELSIERIERAWRAAGFEAQVLGTMSTTGFGDTELDELELKVHKAFLKAPQTEGAPDDKAVRAVGQHVAGYQGRAVRWTGARTGVRLMGDRPTPHTLAELDHATLISSEVDGDSVRRSTVDVVSTIAPAPEYHHEGRSINVRAYMDTVCRNLAGEVTDAGLIEATEVAAFAMTSNDSPYALPKFSVTTRVVVVTTDPDA